MNDPLFIGSIADEFYPSLAKHFPVWVEAIKRVRKEKPEKVFYPYIAGDAKGLRSFVEPLAETGCVFAYERYLPEKRTEKEAKEYLERRLKNEMVEFNKYAPGFAKQCIYVLGFLCGPRESCNKNPATDILKGFIVSDDDVFVIIGVNASAHEIVGENLWIWTIMLSDIIFNKNIFRIFDMDAVSLQFPILELYGKTIVPDN